MNVKRYRMQDRGTVRKGEWSLVWRSLGLNSCCSTYRLIQSLTHWLMYYGMCIWFAFTKSISFLYFFYIRDAPSPRWYRISWTFINRWIRSIYRYSRPRKARRFIMKPLMPSRNNSRNIWGRSKERRMVRMCRFTKYEKNSWIKKEIRINKLNKIN